MGEPERKVMDTKVPDINIYFDPERNAISLFDSNLSLDFFLRDGKIHAILFDNNTENISDSVENISGKIDLPALFNIFYNSNLGTLRNLKKSGVMEGKNTAEVREDRNSEQPRCKCNVPFSFCRDIMPYKIPTEEEVAEAVRICLNRHSMVSSQRALGEIVRGVMEQKYRVSDERIRRIALSKKLVDIEVRYREASARTLPRTCPVCSGKLRKIKNMTVFGGTVTLGYYCNACTYWTGLTRNVPARYVFVARKRG